MPCLFGFLLLLHIIQLICENNYALAPLITLYYLDGILVSLCSFYMYRSRQLHDLNPNRAHLHRVPSSSCPGPLPGNCVQKKDRRPYSEDVLDASPFVAAFFSWRHSLPSRAFEYPFQPFENQNNGRPRISVVFVVFGTSISKCSFCGYLPNKNDRVGESKSKSSNSVSYKRWKKRISVFRPKRKPRSSAAVSS